MQTQTSNSGLEQAIQLVKRGQKQAAARILAGVLRDNPRDAAAWMWMSACVEARDKQVYCLRQVERIQPGNTAARRGLEKLGAQPVTGGARVFEIPDSPSAEALRSALGPGLFPDAEEGEEPASSFGITQKARKAVAGGEMREQVTELPNPPPPFSAQDGGEVQGRVFRLAIGIVLIIVLVVLILRAAGVSGDDLRPYFFSGGRLALADARVRPGEDLAAAVRNAPRGGVIALEAGDYVLSQPLVIEQPVQLRGAGMDATRILSARPGAVVLVRAEGSINLKDIEVRYSGEEPGDGLVVESGTLQIENCRFSGARLGSDGSGGRGLAFGQLASGMVSQSEMVDNDLAGVELSGQALVTVQNSAVHDNGRYGILVQGSTNPKLVENEINRNGKTGIQLGETARGDIRGNHLEQNGESGIRATDQSAPVVFDNTSEGNALYGIEIRGQSSPVLISNSARRNGKAGIGFFDSAGGAAEANDCSQNELHGISVNENARPYLKENLCNNNRQVGIDFWGNSGGTASNNECGQNGLQGIAVHENAAPILQNNLCRKNGDSGIIFWGNSKATASNNDCSENRLNGISVHDQAAPLLARNTCAQNRLNGIAYYDRSAGMARENQCAGNGTDVITREGQSMPVLSNNRCIAQQ